MAETNPATIADIDAALAKEDAELTSLAAAVEKIDSDVSALLARSRAGTVAPQDFADELSKIQGQTATIAAVVAEASTADALVTGASKEPVEAAAEVKSTEPAPTGEEPAPGAPVTEPATQEPDNGEIPL